jgi:hypothetical protein
MNEYSASYAGAQSGRDGRNQASAAGGCPEPTAVDLANANLRVNAGFDRLAKSIATGSESHAGLGASEIALLLEVIEEKRSQELSTEMSMHRIRSWQGNGFARSILLTDPRVARVYNALHARRQADAEPPLRYFGFSDNAGFRVFEFGRLPQTQSSPKYRVSVSLGFFSRNKMVLQDGPGFCAGLLSRRSEPDDCVASQEDIDDFLARRTPKTADKSRARPRYDAK